MDPAGAVGEWLLEGDFVRTSSEDSFVLSAWKLSVVEVSDSSLGCAPEVTGYV